MSTNPEREPHASWCSRASWTRPETWLALLVALFALSSAWSFGASWPGIDFYQFWLVGRAVREGRVENVYTPQARKTLGEQGFQDALRRAGAQAQQKPTLELQVASYRREIETFSTPLLYGTFGSLATGEYARDKNRWQHVTLLLHVAGVLLAAAAAGSSLAAALGALGVFALWFEPFQADLGNANVNALLLATLAGALCALVRGRGLLAGLVLGLGIAFKPTLALAALPLCSAWAFSRAWSPLARLALGLLAGGTLGFVLGGLLGGGFAAWGHWLAEIPALLREGALYEDNFALARWLSDHLHLAPGALLVPILLAPLAFVAWRSRTAAPDAARSAEWLALGALFALLTPGLVWIHYYVLAIPAVLLVAARGTLPMLGLASLAALLLSARVPAQWLGLAGTAQQAHVVLLGALLAAAALLVRPARSQRARDRGRAR